MSRGPGTTAPPPTGATEARAVATRAALPARLVRGPRAYLWLIAVVALVPAVAPDPYVIHIVTLALMHAALTSSWNLLTGYAGLFSFGHQAFFGLGAYVSALMAMRLGLSPWLTLPLGGVLAAAGGFLIALPCLRLRAPPYIAIATLGFAEICRFTTTNLVDLTRGELGLWGIPEMTAIPVPGLGKISFIGERVPYFYLMLALYVATMALLYRLVRSPFGLALKSVRDSQDAAESLGVDITRAKVAAFVISSFLAGVVGAFYAHYVLILTPSAVLSVGVMVEIVAMTLVGGLGTFLGPTIGAFTLTLVLEYLRVLGEYRLLIYGVLLIVIILFMPEGVARRVLPRRAAF